MSPAAINLAGATPAAETAVTPQIQTQISLQGKVIASISPLSPFLLSLTHFSVTGANRGIGLGIAECCLSNAASKIYSIDITEPGDDFAALSKRYPGRLFAATADVTKEDSVTAAVDRIVEESGALHGMVVNAGRTNHKSALDFTQADIEALFNVNVSCFWRF
jgi:NAD(P)-dependent dehydrogenase (short-subunit alcohol dehydrogenase family)